MQFSGVGTQGPAAIIEIGIEVQTRYYLFSQSSLDKAKTKGVERMGTTTDKTNENKDIDRKPLKEQELQQLKQAWKSRGRGTRKGERKYRLPTRRELDQRSMDLFAHMTYLMRLQEGTLNKYEGLLMSHKRSGILIGLTAIATLVGVWLTLLL